MYLVHATLRARPGSTVPGGLLASVRAQASADDGLEHAVVHPLGPGAAVVGMFLRAPRLADAERAAGLLCRRALAADPALLELELASCEAPLVGAFYERLLGGPPGGWPE
ncbi:hypothetical protein [Kitasatospora sp. LaBMicrA B282]|uniref:hypothetical protein n=1 Tax=Kitasatospora sp. LaBMicrA B282 TaxID=3420949 RepID=UPI003D0A7DD4